MERNDLILDDNYNPLCRDGDFAPDNSDAQNVQLIMISTKGAWKESPTVGCGLVHWVKKPTQSLRAMKREITVQLEADGYKATGFNVDENGEFTIDYKPIY